MIYNNMKVRNTLRWSHWGRSKIGVPFGSRPIKNISPTCRYLIAIFICCSKSILIEAIIGEAALPKKYPSMIRVLDLDEINFRLKNSGGYNWESGRLIFHRFLLTDLFCRAL